VFLVFPKINAYLLAYVCLTPLLVDVLKNANSPRQSALKGFVFGAVSMGLIHLGMFELRAFAPLWGIGLLWGLYTIGTACVYGVVTTLIYVFRQSPYKVLVIPALWVIAEWAMGLGPLGHPSLGVSQVHLLPVLQLAWLGGVYAISFFIVATNILVYQGVTTYRYVKPFIAVFVLVIVVIAFGGIRLHYYKEVSKGLTVSVIQGNHPQLNKLKPANWRGIFQDYLSLSRKAAKQSAQLIVWPETILPSLNLDTQWFKQGLYRFSQNVGTPLLFGTPIEESQAYYNAMVLSGKTGIPDQMYRKVKLMMYGEYIPLKGFLERIGLTYFQDWVEYSSGVIPTLIDVNGYKVGGGICLEAVYPGFFRTSTRLGADLLVVLANNAWFYNSNAAEFLFHMSILRAVENNRYLIQAANTGISGIIHPTGKIVTKSNLGTRKILTGTVRKPSANTPYSYLGNWIVWVSMIILFWGSSGAFLLKHWRASKS